MTIDEVEKQVGALVESVRPIDPLAANRLENVQQLLQQSQVGELAEHDARALVEVTHFEEAAVAHFRRGDSSLTLIEIFRNALILFPIIYTWWEISQAAGYYGRALDRDPALIEKPFLLLWQQGFGALGGRPFSSVAGNAVWLLLFVIVAMAVFHWWKEHREHQVEARAVGVRQEVEQALWALSCLVAAERYRQRVLPIEAADKMIGAVESFDLRVQELLDLLAAERQRLTKLANRREREVGDLKVFGSDLREGTERLFRHGQQLEQLYAQLQEGVTRLGDRVEQLGQQQADVLTALSLLGTHSNALLTITKEAGQSLTHAAGELKVAAARDRTDLDSIANAVHDLQRLIDSLLERDGTLRSAVVELSDELRGTFGRLDNMIGQHEKVSQQLTGVTAELADLNQGQALLSQDVQRDDGALHQGIHQLIVSLNEAAKAIDRVVSHNGDLTAGLELAVGELSTVGALNRELLGSLKTRNGKGAE